MIRSHARQRTIRAPQQTGFHASQEKNVSALMSITARDRPIEQAPQVPYCELRSIAASIMASTSWRGYRTYLFGDNCLGSGRHASLPLCKLADLGQACRTCVETAGRLARLSSTILASCRRLSVTRCFAARVKCGMGCAITWRRWASKLGRSSAEILPASRHSFITHIKSATTLLAPTGHGLSEDNVDYIIATVMKTAG